MVDVSNIWKQVQADSAARSLCPRHHYDPNPNGYRLGEKLTCTVCGVADRLGDIGKYIAGYVSAGGNGNDILPGWGKSP
jgi:hypothetical protein